jgi:hypothetical protein
MGLADRLKAINQAASPQYVVQPSAPMYVPPIDNQQFNMTNTHPAVYPQIPSQQMAPQQPFGNTNQHGPYLQPIKRRIDMTIIEKNLQHFYPQNSPQYTTLLNRVSNIDFATIASKRQIPMELAFDFAAMSLFDTVVFIDDSGSMNFNEFWQPSSEKIEDLKLILGRITDIATQFDDDGISLRFFNNSKVLDNVKAESESDKAVDDIVCSGGTPIGKAIVSKVLQPYVYSKAQSNQLTKPVLIYVITDGVPDNKQELKQNILQCKQWLEKTPYGKRAVSLMFAQVGRDAAASEYLKTELDNDPDIGDDVDATGNYELESSKYAKKGVDLTPDLWILQMMLGAVCKEYDEGND